MMMKRRMKVLTLGLLICSAGVAGTPVQNPRVVNPDPAIIKAATDSLHKRYTEEQLKHGVYVGSSLCLACHKSVAGYSMTNHASFIRRPLPQYTLIPGKGVIANSLKGTKDDFLAGLDFNTLTGTPFDNFKPNAPKLSVEHGTYYVSVGSIRAPVIATLAGQRASSFVPAGSPQRYLVRIPVSDGTGGLSASVYVAPFTYAPGVGYAPATGGWYDSKTNAPKLTAGMNSAAVSAAGLSNQTLSCVGCHTNATRSITKTASGEYQFKGFADVSQRADDPTVLDYDNDGTLDIMNIGCEACHGAGSNHVTQGGDPNLIVNPARLNAAAQTEICARCHIESKSVPAGTFAWPYNDDSGVYWTPFDAKAGKPISDFYAPTHKMWPDGLHVVRHTGRAFNAFKTSSHASIACTGCHNPHAEGEGSLLRESITKADLTIPAKENDNTLCLSCHAAGAPFEALSLQDVLDGTHKIARAQEKIAKTVEAHTHHPYAPEREMGLSRCTVCHMVTGHNFDAISPALTLKYATTGNGMVNSCAAACHNNKVDVWGFGVKGTNRLTPSTPGTDISTWINPFDVRLATKLQMYFGDAGIWWKTGK